MPNPFMNIGQMSGGQGMAPMTQNPQPQMGPMGQPQQMMGGGGMAGGAQPGQPIPPQNTPQDDWGAPTLESVGGAFRRRMSGVGSAGLQGQSRQLQTQMGQLMSTMQAAQAQGAPPSVIQQLQSAIQNIQMQIEWAQTDMNQAREAEQRSAERRVLEQQLGREQSYSRGGGNVGGPANDPRGGRMSSLEDAILANSLGLGGGLRRF